MATSKDDMEIVHCEAAEDKEGRMVLSIVVLISNYPDRSD